jgi:hypothetical protein
MTPFQPEESGEGAVDEDDGRLARLGGGGARREGGEGEREARDPVR